jgi:uncharacterized membrane protein
LFIGSWYFRTYGGAESANVIQYGLSFAAVALALVAGWLGGELVERLGVGVDDGAHLNAPNSLSAKPAAENVSENL